MPGSEHSPKVSVITPTYGRPHFHQLLLDIVRSQTYDDFEWLVLDDSASRSEILANSGFSKLKYFHVPDKHSVGAKRNWLAERASGEIIVHFDDDDYYAPDYIARSMREMERGRYDFMNLRSWFFYDFRNSFFGYWVLTEKVGLHFRCGSRGMSVVSLDGSQLEGNELGWGGMFCYRKDVWNKIKFPDLDWNEDGAFSRAAKEQFNHGGWFDDVGLFLHLVHTGNTSTCYAQFNLPAFTVRQIFPGLPKSLLGI